MFGMFKLFLITFLVLIYSTLTAQVAGKRTFDRLVEKAAISVNENKLHEADSLYTSALAIFYSSDLLINRATKGKK